MRILRDVVFLIYDEQLIKINNAKHADYLFVDPSIVPIPLTLYCRTSDPVISHLNKRAALT